MAEKRKTIIAKEKQINELTDFLKGKKVVGILSITSLPSPQLQEIKKKLRGKAEIKIVKSLIITKSIEKIGNENLKKLIPEIRGPSGIITSSENPFKLYKLIKQNRSRVAAKADQIAPDDITVPAGETDLPAGPALGELKVAKIDVKIDKGKIVIQKDSIVAKKGEKITAQVANALGKLGIKPMQIGLDINALYEDGIIYKTDVLDIDETTFINSLFGAIKQGINLSVSTNYPTPQTIELMIQNATRKAQNLAVNAEIMNSFTIDKLLSKANMQAQGLKALLK